VDGQEVPTVVLEFSPGLLRLYGVWHCHDEAVPLLPTGLDVFWKLLRKASTQLHSMMQNSARAAMTRGPVWEAEESPLF
jgi:hypothetical protein